LVRVNNSNIEFLKVKIGKLKDRGGTNIANGMDMAFKVIQ
jgi:hypothetical protein